MKVQKRNDKYETLNFEKLKRSIATVLVDNGVATREGTDSLARMVLGFMPKDADVISTTDLGNLVEKTLMAAGHHDAAKSYILYRDKHHSDGLLEPDNTLLGDYIHATKYARHQEDLNRREIYEETVDRVFDMHRSRLEVRNLLTAVVSGNQTMLDLLDQAREAVKLKKILPSMRSMQFGGRAIALNNTRIYNCAFVRMETQQQFRHILFMLLSGCGVGFSVQFEHIELLPKVKTIDKTKVLHHKIADSIEGWSDAVNELVYSYYDSGVYVEFDYSAIRAEGSPLHTSGGKAPGHLGLKTALDAIRMIFDRAVGRRLRPLEVHDIICWLADCVLSGGIRRASLLSLFSPDDTEMLYCKAVGNFRPASDGDAGFNAQREMANNSGAVRRNDPNGEYYFKRLVEVGQQNYGDPAFMFVNNSEEGTNPCGEIGLKPLFGGAQFCNLCEVNVSNLESVADFNERCKLAAFVGTLQASYTDFDYLGEATVRSTEREALLGIGLMGIYDGLDILCKDDSGDVLKFGANIVKNTNRKIAKILGIKPAARCTTVKPGGTAPLEASYKGVVPASGITPHHSDYYFRRVTAKKNEPAAQYLYSLNPHMFEEKPDGDWSITFCVKASDQAVILKDVTALQHLDMIHFVYNNWVKEGTRNGGSELTHNVSSTVVVDDSELSSVISYIWAHRNEFAAVSFVPPTLDKLFRFAPREAISTDADKFRWNQLVSMTRPVNFNGMVEDEDTTNLKDVVACAGGACEV